MDVAGSGVSDGVGVAVSVAGGVDVNVAVEMGEGFTVATGGVFPQADKTSMAGNMTKAQISLIVS